MKCPECGALMRLARYCMPDEPTICLYRLQCDCGAVSIRMHNTPEAAEIDNNIVVPL